VKAFLSPFTPDEELVHLRRMNEGDNAEREELILRNMRLVAHVAKKYQNKEEDMEDLISIGTIGLIKAISTYSVNYKNRLATYAARCIENELLMYFRAKKKISREVSLYEPVGVDKEGNQIRLVDIVECEDPDIVEEMESEEKISRALELVDNILDERERQVIIMRYGLYNTDPLPQREIADKLGISRSYVSRIEKAALSKLYSFLGAA
jgi:RNA polymerase sporulation-specific sigma factor